MLWIINKNFGFNIVHRWKIIDKCCWNKTIEIHNWKKTLARWCKKTVVHGKIKLLNANERHVICRTILRRRGQKGPMLSSEYSTGIDICWRDCDCFQRVGYYEKWFKARPSDDTALSDGTHCVRYLSISTRALLF